METRARAKMRRLCALPAYVLLLSVMSAILLLARSVHAAADAAISDNHAAYIDEESGGYVIVGEVKNRGDVAIKGVLINATLYDSGGGVVATASATAHLSVLLSGRVSPFAVMLWDVAKSALVHHYALGLKFSPLPEGRPKALEITSTSTYVEARTGWKHVNGTAKNAGSKTGTSVYVVMTCYDQNGTLVDVHHGWTSPENLAPGQTGAFDLALPRRARAALTASYALAVEYREYAMVAAAEPQGSLVVVCGLMVAATEWRSRLRSRVC